MARGYLIGEGYRDRIDRTISRVDGLVDGSAATQIPTRLQELGGSSQKVFRICTFTGSWAIGSDKTVTFKGVTTTPNTVTARNLFCGLDPSSSCDVSIAKDGTAWYLVQPNLTQQPGYSASGTQVLTITNGSLRWVGTTSCT